MFKNYLKTAVRNILRHKGYSFINIAGLALGMACCILILLWVTDELSFDRFNKNYNDIYRVIIDDQFQDSYAVTPAPLGKALLSDYPEVMDFVRLRSEYKVILKINSETFVEKDFTFADPSIFDIFTFKFLHGSAKEALSSPDSIILTEAAAVKYFGETNPMGKTLTVNNRFDFTVSGIIKNVPPNSHFTFNILAPFPVLKKFGKEIESWGSYGYRTYVRLRKGTDYKPVSLKMKHYLKKHSPDGKITLRLQPLRDIHLHSASIRSRGGSGDIRLVYVFTMIATFILIIACINFMNLTTARASNRAREVGMRKVTGARRIEIIKQFFGESILLSFIGLILALFLVDLLLPVFNELCGKQLHMDIFTNGGILVWLIGIALCTGILSGVYPALFLSSFQPINVLKGGVVPGTKKSWLRKVLVVTQFTLSTLLIIATIVVYHQMNYMRNRELGFNKDHLAYIRMPVAMDKQYESIKNEFLSDPNVINVCAASNLPVNPLNSTEGVEWEGKKPQDEMLINISFTGYDYAKTLNVKMADGRFFSRAFSTDVKGAYVVNETAANVMGMKSPVGKWFKLHENKGIIVGVVKDFNFTSLHRKIEPLLMSISPEKYSYFLVRIKSDSIFEAIDSMKTKWQESTSGLPFEYGFMDERIDNLYRTEKRIGKSFLYFTVLSIFIACLGLFGLASYLTEQRKKEVGIRKVLGAPVKGIVFLVSKEFLKWVILANIISWPAAYFAVDRLLQVYAYRISIGPLPFVAALVFALLIAVFTVSYQSIKAGLTNPVEALRYE